MEDLSNDSEGSCESTQSLDFRVLFESAPGLYLVLTAELKIVAVSNSYLRATMTEREAILGRCIFDVFPDNPNDLTATGVRNLTASLERVIERRVVDSMAVQKYDIPRPESEGAGFEERYWSPINTPVLRENGELAYIIHQVEDVTESVRQRIRGLEQEKLANEHRIRGIQLEADIVLREQEIVRRRQVEGELRKAEERMRSIVDHVVDGIIAIDEHGTVESFNPAAVKIFGYESSEVVGQNVKMLMPEPFHGEHDGYLENYLRTGIAKIIGSGREVVGRRKDGSTFPMELSVSTFQLGEDRYFTGMVRDISSRKVLEAQFQQAQKMEIVGRLAGGVAHDLNNLLAVVLGCCQFLENDAGISGDSRGLVEDIYKAGMRATSLTRQLLAFSRQQILQPKVLNLNEVVSETVTMLSRMIGEDVEFATKLSPGLWPVNVDAGQMSQVIMNLAVNARDAMQGGGKITFETVNGALDETYAATHRDVKAGPYVVLSISDTGCGMDEITKARIFEPFFTTKEIGKGTGLGLATVFGIVKQSNGHIVVRSDPAIGTTFTVYLPKVDNLAKQSKGKTSQSVLPRGNETVLIAEDEEMILSLASRILQSQGYEVLQAKNGEEALSIYERHSGTIHLVLADVVMPKLGGRQLIDRLHEIQPNLKALFMSGYTDDAVIRHGILAAEADVIEKPFTFASLANAVRNVLDR